MHFLEKARRSLERIKNFSIITDYEEDEISTLGEQLPNSIKAIEEALNQCEVFAEAYDKEIAEHNKDINDANVMISQLEKELNESYEDRRVVGTVSLEDALTKFLLDNVPELRQKLAVLNAIKNTFTFRNALLQVCDEKSRVYPNRHKMIKEYLLNGK